MRYALLVLSLALRLTGADFDILIRNARVVDGTGNPWFQASVGIRAGRIAAIGKLTNAVAARVIDARGHVLAPGFIDIHTHVEESLLKLPTADNYVADGSRRWSPETAAVRPGTCPDSSQDWSRAASG